MELTTDTLTVLLVEDDDVDAEAAMRPLRRMDSAFTVVREQRLEDACAYLETARVDLVLLDLGLPDSQGLATLDRMRACAGHVPVVVLTGRQDEALGMEAIRHGAQDYLTKHELTPRLLARVVRYAIERGRSQERLARAQRIAGLGNWEHDLRRGDIYWSEQTLRIFGWGSRPISYDAFMAAVHPDDRAELRRQRERALTGEAPIDARYRFRRPDGTVCVVHQQGEAEFDEHGRPWRLSGTVLEITEQVAREERLQLLATSVAESQDAIIITDADLEPPAPRIVFVNEAFTRMTGYTADEVLGQSPRLLQGPETDRALLDRLKSALQRGETFEGETTNYRKDGTPYVVEWSITPVRDDEGTITHFVSVQRDVTERRVAEEHRARLAAIVESTDDAIFSKTLDGSITSWNAGAERLYGYTADEIIGQSVLQLFPPERREEFDQIVASVRAGESVKQQETVRAHKDGSRLEVALTVSPIRDRKEAIVGASVIARDISAQKAMERAHRLSEARLQLALEAAEMVTWDWDVVTGTLHYSENVYGLFELAPDELGDTLGDFLALVHPDDRDTVTERIWTTLKEGLQDFEYEYRTRPPSGKERWVWTRGRVFYEAGRPVRAIGTSFDITARKQAEQALQDSEASYRNLFESVREAIFIHDRAGRFIDVNPSALDMYGYEKDELQGQTPALLAAPGKNDVEEAMADIQRAFAGEPQRLEWWGRRKSGEVFPHEVLLSKGHYFGEDVVIATVRDITAQKEYEQALIEAKESAEEMNRLKSTFLANMSHEIRTPLTSIIGFAELLDEEIEGPQNEFVDLIARGGRRLLVTLNSVLDLSRLESGEMTIERRPLRLQRVVEQVVQSFAKEADRKGITLETAFPSEPTYALTDEGAFTRVLTNLLSNAIKFTAEGGIVVRLTPRDDDQVAVQVEDTGVGISTAFLPHLFDEFKQESEGNSRAFEGTGLGLSITKRLVELIEGTITVDSAKDEGSTFTVCLPSASTAPARRTMQAGS